jgi:hypothetical protein
MRHVTLALLLTISACTKNMPDGGKEPATGGNSFTASQQAAMEDSAKTFIDHAVQLVMHPDSGAVLKLYPQSDSVVFVEDGKLITSLKDLAKMAGAQAHQAGVPPTVTIDSRKIDVLAPDAAAVTITFTGAGTDPQTRKKQTVQGAYTVVLAIRDGATRSIQGHQSIQPPQ